MQYRRTFAVLLLAVFVAAPDPSARGQAPGESGSTQNVARLQNFGTMVAFLNLASGTVRLVAIVEPSSPACAAAMEAVQSVLDANSSKRLRAYMVWTRVSEQDTEMRALSMANEVRDRRLIHFWDGEGFVADAFRGTLGSGEHPATGVLLLYDTDARLALDPPAPAMWMSVNPGLQGSTLDSVELGAQANSMVRRVEAKVTHGAAQNP